MSDLIIRPMQIDDLPFVKSTWLRHYKDHSDFAKPIRNSLFFPRHSKIIDQILMRENTEALIASHIDEPDVILGFLIHETQDVPVIHYAYVVEKARGLGVGREMIEHSKLTRTSCAYTHRTTDAKSISRKYETLTYDPYRT